MCKLTDINLQIHILLLCKFSELILQTGNTPLHRATMEHRVDVINHLVTLPGIDINIMNQVIPVMHGEC